MFVELIKNKKTLRFDVEKNHSELFLQQIRVVNNSNKFSDYEIDTVVCDEYVRVTFRSVNRNINLSQVYLYLLGFVSALSKLNNE